MGNIVLIVSPYFGSLAAPTLSCTYLSESSWADLSTDKLLKIFPHLFCAAKDFFRTTFNFKIKFSRKKKKKKRRSSVVKESKTLLAKQCTTSNHTFTYGVIWWEKISFTFISFLHPTGLNSLPYGGTAQVPDFRPVSPVPPWRPGPGRCQAWHLLGARGAQPQWPAEVWQHPEMLDLGASAQQDQSCPSLLWPNPQDVRVAANIPSGDARGTRVPAHCKENIRSSSTVQLTEATWIGFF